MNYVNVEYMWARVAIAEIGCTYIAGWRRVKMAHEVIIAVISYDTLQ
jgi:hypothetical protein